MSLGGFLGGAIGGTIGFFLGGPMGAVYGAGLGLGVGVMIDPITADVPTPGLPNPEKSVTISTIGDPCPDLLGIGKITGHLLIYLNERSEAQYSETSSGGKGGSPSSSSQLSGYKYYATWALGFVKGPVDILYTIFKNDNVVWEGYLECPVSGGQETVTLLDMGSCTFYFGTDDQIPNTTLGGLMDDETLNTPYRNYCWAVFNDCYIGNYPRMPTMTIMVQKTPVLSFNSNNIIKLYDYNPAHALWYILNNLTGLPESYLNESSFSQVANTLLSENRGISVLLKDQTNAMTYIQSINSHIDNILRYGSDGKFYTKLIRDDYVVDDLLLVDENTLLETPVFSRKAWIDTLNEIKVQYSELINLLTGFYGAGQNGYRCIGLPIDIAIDELTRIIIGDVISVACFNDGAMFVTETGQLYGIGKNASKVMPGIAENVELLELTLLDEGPWKQVSCMNNHTLLLSQSGFIFSCGWNSHGQLGLGLPRDNYGTNLQDLTMIGINSDWEYIHAGVYTSYFINTSHQMYDCGYGGFGNLGLGNNVSYLDLQLVPESISWKYVTTPKNFYSMASAIDIEDNLYGCGANSYGQLGLGYSSFRPNEFEQSLVSGLKVKKIQLTGTSSQEGIHILTTDGDIYVAGHGSYNKLGLDDGQLFHIDPVKIAGSDYTDIETHAMGGFNLTAGGLINRTGGALGYWGGNVAEWTPYDDGEWIKLFGATNNLYAWK